MKKCLTALLICALAVLACALGSAEGGSFLGRPLADFSVKTIDGDVFTLSESLKDHDMVLINLWASWCGPCQMEFPFLEEAWQQYRDRVAVIALSVEAGDTEDVLRRFAEEMGLTFPVGSDSETRLSEYFNVYSIPTSVVVDRFGNVALVEAGAKTKASAFTALFDHFLDDAYAETAVLDAFPTPQAPKGASAAELDAAANAEGSALHFQNVDGLWPMLPVTEDGRATLAASNAGADDSEAAVAVEVTANDGDALAFDFRTSSEPAYDALLVQVDGDTIKAFTGEHEWTPWALPLAAGPHEVRFVYSKDSMNEAGEDRAWISNVRVVSGAEAEALLAAVPARPVGEAFEMRVQGDARRVLIDDPNGVLARSLGTAEGLVVGGDAAALELTLTEAEDPETVVISAASPSTGVHAILSEALKADGSGYEWAVPLDADGFSIVTMQPAGARSAEDMRFALLFRDEGGVEQFMQFLTDNSIHTTWRYAEGS